METLLYDRNAPNAAAKMQEWAALEDTGNTDTCVLHWNVLQEKRETKLPSFITHNVFYRLFSAVLSVPVTAEAVWTGLSKWTLISN